MRPAVDETHDPRRESWVTSANLPASEFPIQNLPFGRFRPHERADWSIGIAIGDQVLDLALTGLTESKDMNELMGMEPWERRAIRRSLCEGLTRGSNQEAAWRRALVPQANVQMGLPCKIGDYSDFYVSVHHATNVGKLFRPDNPLLPNYKWVPIGYHGRASTIAPSGQDFHRPMGQVKGPDDDAPRLGASQRLDFELELGVLVGKGNRHGHPIPLNDAEDHIFGLTLFNDWSARDLQSWESQPLGPFLSKSFASTMSPWVVTLEALAPFRKAFHRPHGDPAPLPYLDGDANRRSGAFDIQLQVRLQTKRMRDVGARGELISTSNYAEAAYWTASQLVAHHAVNGCSLNPGDLLGTGTLSGPLPDQAGSLLELTEGGKRALRLQNGEERVFLSDGDAIELSGLCERDGYRSIGFGTCTATVLPALKTLKRAA